MVLSLSSGRSKDDTSAKGGIDWHEVQTPLTSTESPVNVNSEQFELEIERWYNRVEGGKGFIIDPKE